MADIILKRKISNRVIDGHPWIFANEINDLGNIQADGQIADVYTHDRKFIGKGYTNPKSQIAVRLVTRNKNEEINRYDVVAG